MAEKTKNRFFEKIFFRLPPKCFYVPKMKFLALKGKKKTFVAWCAPLIEKHNRRAMQIFLYNADHSKMTQT